MKKLAIVILFLIVFLSNNQSLKANPESETKLNLNGVYQDDIGTVYYLRTVEDKLYFVGENEKRNFAHVFVGSITGNTIKGQYYDVPKYAASGSGS